MASKSFFSRLNDLPRGQGVQDRVGLANSCKGTCTIHAVQSQLIILVAESRELLQRMKQVKALAVHEGCVNTLCWNSKGTCILSGSDDQRLVITDVFKGKVCFCRNIFFPLEVTQVVFFTRLWPSRRRCTGQIFSVPSTWRTMTIELWCHAPARVSSW